MRALPSIIALALMSACTSADVVDRVPTPQFPRMGMPYADARAMLIQQDIKPNRKRSKFSDKQYRELVCDPDRAWERKCRAVFYQRSADGWQIPVSVWVNPSDMAVERADYPAPVEGLLSIPPPIPADMPNVRGSYLGARPVLRRMGFKPARNGIGPAAHCPDSTCKKLGYLPEAQCATDMPLCIAYWSAPDGRVLKIQTVGEIDLRISFMSWAPRKELIEFEAKP